jgi:D-alanyl-D-alanine dipeptidase
MPTGYDDFSDQAHVGATGISVERAAHARKHRQAMERRGFRVLPTEWWHFDVAGWQRYPVISGAEPGWMGTEQRRSRNLRTVR